MKKGNIESVASREQGTKDGEMEKEGKAVRTRTKENFLGGPHIEGGINQWGIEGAGRRRNLVTSRESRDGKKKKKGAESARVTRDDGTGRTNGRGGSLGFSFPFPNGFVYGCVPLPFLFSCCF